ncbi:hypothetical protein GCM10009039_24230 [Halocalculus aciditolerans]|uniref:Uncharacterized protein n=1 Tax=Halocalculus aciditolerans TaxID=1383812 RepID=A0A830FNQ8_9EURY|nr:hypothetical protein GCM10009039_24230 [Halocalculus aciditolerans]
MPVSLPGNRLERQKIITSFYSILVSSKRDNHMSKLGLWTNAIGLLISIVGTLLLFSHTTNQYHAAIQDIGSIAVGYLGLILLGVSVSVTGVALLLAANDG